MTTNRRTTKQAEPAVTMTQDMLEKMMDRVSEIAADAGAKSAAAIVDKMIEDRESRTTRAQESRGSEQIHEPYDDMWDEPLLLDATNIPPRPGYAQYWVRSMLDNRPDHGNIAKRLSRGWRPRPVDTAPKGVSPPKVNFEDYTNIIGVYGMILMERPVELHERRKRGVRARTDAQMQAVDSDLMRDHEPGRGFGKPHMNVQSKISRGSPKVMDDAG